MAELGDKLPKTVEDFINDLMVGKPIPGYESTPCRVCGNFVFEKVRDITATTQKKPAHRKVCRLCRAKGK